MKKVVIHIFHDNKSSLGTGSHVSERIRQVKEQHGVELEVYVFRPREPWTIPRTRNIARRW
jgi:hypothetical protein